MAHRLEKKWRSSDIKLEEKINFSVLIQNKQVLKGLKAAGFQRPSPVQAKAIPIARLGVDMFIQAKSGTGKTLVFSIAILERLKNTPKLQMLVIVPTREIAIQVQEVIYDISSGFPGLRCQCFVGGFPISHDMEKANDCQIAVGTPGRIRHLIESGSLSTSCIKTVVLDEADKLCGGNMRMFGEVQAILRSLPFSKQIIAVSATYENEAYENIHAYMKSPRYVNMSENELALAGVTQFFHVVEAQENDEFASKEKFEVLKNILCSVTFAQCLIFCRSIKIVQSFCSDLVKWNFPASAITGTDEQSVRFCTMDRLKKHRIKILVSSDLTSRGIDAENIDLVIHLDPSKDLETYLHRVGRAGRYGSKGVSIAIVSNENEVIKLASYKTRAQLLLYLLPDPVPRCLNKYIPADKDENSIFEYIKNDVEAEKEDTQSSKSSTHEDDAEKDGEVENDNVELNDIIDSDSEESALSEEEKPDEHTNAKTNGNLTYSVSKHAEESSDEDVMDFPEDNDKDCSSDSEEVPETNSSEVQPSVPNEMKVKILNGTETPPTTVRLPPKYQATTIVKKRKKPSVPYQSEESLSDSEIEDQIMVNQNLSRMFCPKKTENLSTASDVTPCKVLPPINDDRKSDSLQGKDGHHSDERENGNQSCDALFSLKGEKNDCDIRDSVHFSNKNKNKRIEKTPNKKGAISVETSEQDFQLPAKNKILKLKGKMKNLVINEDNECEIFNEVSNDFGSRNSDKRLSKGSQDNRYHSSAKKIPEKQDLKSHATSGNDCPITRTGVPQRFLKSRPNQKFINFNNRNDSYGKSYKSPNTNVRKYDTRNKKSFQTKAEVYEQPDNIYHESPQRYSRSYSYESKNYGQYKFNHNYFKNKDGKKTKECNYKPSQRSFQEHKSNRRHHKSYDSHLGDEILSDPEDADHCPTGQSPRRHKFNHHAHFPASNDKNMQPNDRLQHEREVPHSKHGRNCKFVKPHCPFCNSEVCCERFSNMAASSLYPLSQVFRRNDSFFPDRDTNPMKWLLHPFKSYPPQFDDEYDGDIDYGKYLHEKYLSTRNKCLSKNF